jgi:pyridoxine kinase
MKTVVAIHDLSCFAKSSLTVVIPTLSAMGIEVAVLPTALLSTQTGGFSDFYYQDLSSAMQAIIKHWDTLSLRFNAIYSGFLGSEQQIDIVTSFIQDQRSKGSPLVVVDPVLGDDGSAYEPITSELVRRMIELVHHADVITPNVTEAALLLGEPYKSDLKPQEAVGWAKRLSALGPRWVAITSVLQDNGGVVVCYDGTRDEQAISYQAYAPISYPGSGDLFASILCALLLKGDVFLSAAVESARLVSKAVFASWNAGMECRHGVSVELIIQELMGASKV